MNARVTRRPNVGVTALNFIGATPFFMAARGGDAELMRLLVELGADPLLPNEDGTTPLMAAAGVGTHSPGEDAGAPPEALEAVKLALELGNDVNAVDKNGNTAMHGAAFKQLPEVVKVLAPKGREGRGLEQEQRVGLDAAADRRRRSPRHELPVPCSDSRRAEGHHGARRRIHRGRARDRHQRRDAHEVNVSGQMASSTLH